MTLPETLKKVRVSLTADLSADSESVVTFDGYADATLDLTDGFAHVFFPMPAAEVLVLSGDVYMEGSELTGLEFREEMPVCLNAYDLDGVEHVELYPLWMPLGPAWEEL